MRDQELQIYNRQVLQNQDEAFSLAYDLLGTEGAAAALLQEVFMSGFGRRKDACLPFRLRVMRWVVRACLEHSQVLGPEQLEPRLAQLTNEEKVALVLLERLGLNSLQAAAVLEKSAADFRALVTRARCALSGAWFIQE